MFKKILVPLDGTPLAEEALPYARSLAQEFNSSVHLTTVVGLQRGTESAEAVVGVDPKRATETQETEEAMARDYLERVAHDFKDVGIPVQQEVHAAQSTAGELIAAAREQDIDLAVVATHARVGLDRTLLGSVTDELLRDPAFPVLAVRAEERGVSAI